MFSCLFQCFEEKGYQMESKQNETFGKVIFGTEPIQGTWSACQRSFEEATRVGASPLSRGPLERSPTDFFKQYIPIYPKTIEDEDRSGVPPPQASVATKNLSGPCYGTLPEGGIPQRWPSSSPRRSPWRGGSSSPSGLRVCTSRYAFDISLSLVF